MQTGKVPLSTAEARESIITERLVLRPLQESDAEAIFAYNEAHPEVRRYSLVRQVSRSYAQQFVRWGIGGDAPLTQTARRVLLRRLSQRNRRHRGFLRLLDYRRGRANHGADRLRTVFRFLGRGYMTEAARALIAYAFTQVGVRCITANCFKANRASIRVLEKAGMQQGPVRFRDRLVFWMSWNFRPLVSYVVSYAMTRDEWQTPKAVQ